MLLLGQRYVHLQLTMKNCDRGHLTRDQQPPIIEIIRSFDFFLNLLFPEQWCVDLVGISQAFSYGSL